MSKKVIWVQTEHLPNDVKYYLTKGKPYRCELRDEEDAGLIPTDLGTETYILLKGCAHLGGGDWDIVDEPDAIGMGL